MPPQLAQHMDTYMNGLFAVATDASPDVRKRVCEAMVMLLDVDLARLAPQMPNVITYMLQSTQDADETVALEACEFWSAICETAAVTALEGVLPQLTPVLLNGMVYSEVDIMILQGDDDDEGVEDRPEEMKPRFHRSRVVGGDGGGGGGGGGEGDEEESDDDDDDDGDGEVAEWNLRKCSASGLDIIAGTFKERILPTLLPLLQERIASDKWEVRESAILALGAIAEGCIEAISPHLPQLAPWLIATLSDRQYLIRSITCWTLSRYTKWIVAQPSHETYLRPLMQELLKRVVDGKKKVQEAACSAFATLEEDAQMQLVPYLQPIITNLMFAFSKYQAKNRLILYDAIGTLADSVGAQLNRPELTGIMMPPLVERWQLLGDEDNGLLPLLECFTSLAQALGVGFQPFAQPVFERCIRLIHTTLEADQMAAASQVDPPDKELLVCALDLISGMAEGLGASIEPLVASASASGVVLTTYLFECMKDPQADVRQSAFALVGDLARACIGQLVPALPQYLPLLTQQLVVDHVSVCNNASWAIGEIAVKVPPEHVAPYVEAALQRLIPIVNRYGEPSLNKSLLENTAITIGRLGYAAAAPLAPHLGTFCRCWCLALCAIRDDIEKEHACLGLCEMIRLNPQAPLNSLMQLCEAVGSWETPPPQLHSLFSQILTGYKGSIPPDQWAPFQAAMKPGLAQRLAERYGV